MAGHGVLLSGMTLLVSDTGCVPAAFFSCVLARRTSGTTAAECSDFLEGLLNTVCWEKDDGTLVFKDDSMIQIGRGATLDRKENAVLHQADSQPSRADHWTLPLEGREQEPAVHELGVADVDAPDYELPAGTDPAVFDRSNANLSAPDADPRRGSQPQGSPRRATLAEHAPQGASPRPQIAAPAAAAVTTSEYESSSRRQGSVSPPKERKDSVKKKAGGMDAVVNVVTKGRKSKWGSQLAKKSTVRTALGSTDKGTEDAGVPAPSGEVTAVDIGLPRFPGEPWPPKPLPEYTLHLATSERAELWREARAGGRHHDLANHQGWDEFTPRHANVGAAPYAGGLDKYGGGCFTRPASVLMASAHAAPPPPAKIYEPPASPIVSSRRVSFEHGTESAPPKTAPHPQDVGSSLLSTEEAEDLEPPSTAFSSCFRAAPPPLIALGPPERPRISLGPVEHRASVSAGGRADVWVRQSSPQAEQSRGHTAPWGRSRAATFAGAERQMMPPAPQTADPRPPKTAPGILEPEPSQGNRSLLPQPPAPGALTCRGRTACGSRTLYVSQQRSVAEASISASEGGPSGSPTPTPTPDISQPASRRASIEQPVLRIALPSKQPSLGAALNDTTRSPAPPAPAPKLPPPASAPSQVIIEAPPSGAEHTHSESSIPPRQSIPPPASLPPPPRGHFPPSGSGPPTAHELLGSLASGSLSARVFVAAISPKGHGRNIATMPKPRPPPIKTGTLASLLRTTGGDVSLEAVWAARIADQVSNSPRADRPDELGVRSTEPLPFSVRPRPRTMQAATPAFVGNARDEMAQRRASYQSYLEEQQRNLSDSEESVLVPGVVENSKPRPRSFSYEPFSASPRERPQTMQSGGQAFFSKEGIMFNRRASYEHRPRHGQHGAQMLRIQ